MLAAEWADSDVGLIAEVDCTTDQTQELCADVDGFPTLRFGEPSSLEDYDGQREYADMSAFAKENLKPSCGLTHLELCDEVTKKVIAEYQEMSSGDLEDLAQEVYTKIEELEQIASEKIMALESEINAIIDEYTKGSEKVKKEYNYKYIVAVLRSKEPEEEDEDGQVGNAEL